MRTIGSHEALRLARRLTGLVLLPVLALAAGGPLLHGCPHHDAPSGSGAAHEEASHPSHGDHHDSGDKAPCTCIGSCHGSSLAPHPVAAIAVVRQASSAPVPVRTAPGVDIPSTPTEYFLPYPNGPPGTL